MLFFSHSPGAPFITNNGIQCKGNECFNKIKFFDRFRSVHLVVNFSGDGPFNISWLFNYSLPPLRKIQTTDMFDVCKGTVLFLYACKHDSHLGCS